MKNADRYDRHAARAGLGGGSAERAERAGLGGGSAERAERGRLGGRGGYWIYGAFAAAVAAALLWRSSEVADGVRAGLAACGGVVIPSLFPFMILAGLIGSTRAGAALSRAVYAVTRRLPGLKNLPECLGSALLMSFIGGFPVGAQTLSGMVENGELDGKTASRALCFSVNAGPSFLISAVGASMLGSREAGLLLLLAQLLSSLVIAAFLFRSRPASAGAIHKLSVRACPVTRTNPNRTDTDSRTNPNRTDTDSRAAENPAPRPDCFVMAVRGAAAGILGICAFVVMFSAISALLASLGVTEFLAITAAKLFPTLGKNFFLALLTGLLEVTGGCAAAAALHTRAGFVLCAFLISFSSLSIIFQVKACFKPDSGMTFSAFYLSRLVHGGLTALFSLPLSLLLPPEVLAAAVSTSAPVPSVAPNMAVTAVCLICMCSILLASTTSFARRSKNFSRRSGNPTHYNV